MFSMPLSEKASFPILVILSEREIDFNPLHLKNAFCSIVFIVLGRVTPYRASQFSNADSLIRVYFFNYLYGLISILPLYIF